jgi:hypothetical protein
MDYEHEDAAILAKAAKIVRKEISQGTGFHVVSGLLSRTIYSIDTEDACCSAP